MSGDANLHQESAATDEARLAQFARELADGIDDAIGGWVVGSVRRILMAYRGAADDETLHRASVAGDEARRAVVPEVRALLALDVDDQRTTPLSLLRRAVAYPTAVLAEAGVPPVERDAVAEQQFPDDIYDLTPARLGDIEPGLDELAIRWGAAKAFVFKARHGA